MRHQKTSPVFLGALCLFAVACKDEVIGADLGGGGEPDLAVAADLACQGFDCPTRGIQYATDSLKLPGGANLFSIDIDGDGRLDNQLRVVVQAISAAGFDLNAQIATAVKNGGGIVLLEVEPKDLQSGPAQLTMQVAAPPMAGEAKPKFDGMDRFRVLPGQDVTRLRGALDGTRLGTRLPKEQMTADLGRFELQLPVGATTLPLTAYGVHIQGTINADGIMSGELHGVVRDRDIDRQVIPAIATLVTAQIHADPASATSETLVRLFEDLSHPATKQKCMQARDCCQKVVDRMSCKILPEEVRDNGLVTAVLRPDVQVFAGDEWRPTPNGPNKDALSVGLGFTAIRARFLSP